MDFDWSRTDTLLGIGKAGKGVKLFLMLVNSVCVNIIIAESFVLKLVNCKMTKLAQILIWDS